MKKAIAVTLSIILVMATVTSVYAAGYSDVKTSHWAAEAVTAMSEKTIVKGYPDGTFKPSSTVTYGEFIKMALIAATSEDAGNSETGNWAEKYYDKALELGYFTEYDIEKADLNNKIERRHMALIISAILGDVKIENYDEIQTGITDITAQTEYEYDITKSYAMGILTGYTDDTFRPEKTLTRAESATVIYRLVDESKRVLPGEDVPEVDNTPAIEEVITNIDSFPTNDGSPNKYLAAAETYEIITDGTKYGLTLKENRGTTWIAIPAAADDELGQIYLMKDGKIIELASLYGNKDGSAVAEYESDITKIDYIVSLDTINNIAKLIVNPFKN